MNPASVRAFEDRAALTRAAADELAARAAVAVAERGVFRLALSGGSTPRELYRLLAREPELLPWPAIELFWGDEREVPPAHPDSNYGAVERDLLRHLPRPPRAVFRIEAERGAEAAARRYEETLRRAFAPPPGAPPRFDLVLLGLGADGHTASLFPGSTALDEHERWVAAPWVEALGARRITLTLPVLNAAAAVLFLAAGADKAAALAAVLAGPRDLHHLPAQGVAPTDGELAWLVDRVAAAGLSSFQ